MNDIKLSTDQQNALSILVSWYKSHKTGSQTKYPYITLGGYAGTGKTTLISIYRNKLEEIHKGIKVAFCAFTGKATQVINSKLSIFNVNTKDTVSTIHSLIYTAILDKDNRIIGWDKKKNLNVDLIIVDEASMVDQNIWYDLLSYRIPILAVGDHGQLPPINSSFNLMEKLNIKLEEIHRQVKDNPIIKLSTIARLEGKIPVGTYSKNVFKLDRDSDDIGSVIDELLDNYNDNTLILCGINTTRIRLNKIIRQKKGFETAEPETRDKIICLSNNRRKNIYNGMVGKIKYIEKIFKKENNENIQMQLDGLENKSGDLNYFVKVVFEGEDKLFEGLISSEQFGMEKTLKQKSKEIELFDFGYALTVHKAQGSQAKKVVLFEEKFSKMSEEDWRKWLYTGITRAEEELCIIG